MTEFADRADRLLQGLNTPQRQAVLHRDGPLVVFAGAGSGKTRIITTRIAYLIESGVPPWQILAVTFTNKAAGEMKERVESLTPRGRGCVVSTFHSACARWLREFAGELGFTSDFTIYDEEDSKSAIKSIVKEIESGREPTLVVNDLAHFIERAKMCGIFPGETERFSNEFSWRVPEGGIAVYKRYQEYLQACNAMDFADLILNVLLLLRKNEMLRKTLRDRFRYVLVDEYQDTNRSQFELVTLLCETHRNLVVVGDDDQSIYSWRGATPSNILDFHLVYPDATRVVLDQNYRCTGHIVTAASAMIAHNKKRADKRLWTDNPEGELITFRYDYDGQSEARAVAEMVQAEKRIFPYQDVAVFYRTNAQSRLMEESFREANIPYQIFGATPFFERLEVKDLCAYLRLLVNESDDVSFRRVVNVPPRKIGPKALEAVEARARVRGESLMKTLGSMIAANDVMVAASLKGFYALVADLRARVARQPLAKAIESIVGVTDYVAYLHKKFPEQAVDKVENVWELGAAMADFARRAGDDSTLKDWLQSVTLNTGAEESSGGVSMMTLHMAKGLEFKRVYIVGIEEGLLPHKSSQDSRDLLEEERRLFYVGMTRARERLALSCAYRRRTFESWVTNNPSRFLREIPPRHIATDGAHSYGAPVTTQTTMPDDGRTRYDYSDADPEVAKRSGPVTSIRIGRSVTHPTYGRGVVESIDLEYGQIMAIVVFEEHGRRRVMGRGLTTVAG